MAIIKNPSGYVSEGGGGIDYSTTEQDTGVKWVDGKPIYKISFSGTFQLSAQHTASIILENNFLNNHNVSNIIKCEGTTVNNNVYRNLVYYVGNYDCAYYVATKNDGNLTYAFLAPAGTDVTVNATFYYTKNT